MESDRIGVLIPSFAPAQTLAAIERAEELGISSAWLTTGMAMPDALTLFAAAAARSKTIKLGTFIVPTFPRHPLVTVQQVEVVAGLAPGRVILGLGISHQPVIEGIFGMPFERPLEHMREYVAIVKAGLHGGAVDFDGARLRAHAKVPNPAPVPVMISALRPNAFRLAGAIADGVLPWLCPAPYLRDVALPAIRAGAASANRRVPPLIPGLPVVLSADRAEVVRAVGEQLRSYLRRPFYSGMLVAAGFPEAPEGEWTDRMIEAVVVHGDEAAVADRLRSFREISGAEQVVASFLPVGADQQGSLERALRFAASL